jgi:acyl-CoA reductase-like NAD-dependent aldehyde dehydrogenase
LNTDTRTSIEECDAVIDGESVGPGVYFDDLDPATGEVLARVARCGSAEIDAAVSAARTTFERDWSRRAPAERSQVLSRIAEAIRRDHESLERLESLDTGKAM